jgi:hypothetical protein
MSMGIGTDLPPQRYKDAPYRSALPQMSNLGVFGMQQGAFGNQGGGGGIVAHGYQGYGSQSGAPSASDPDATLAYMTRADAQAYERDYAQWERDMIERSQNDTSLIDDARVDSAAAAEIGKGVASRNTSRYGVAMTPAQLQQRDRSFERNSTLGGIQSVQDARLAQRDLNQDMLGKIIDVGQGVYQRSMSGMTSAAQNKNALDNAYQAAKAQSKAQTYSTIGTLGSAAIMAAFLL